MPDGTPGSHWAALDSAGRCTGVAQNFGHGTGRTTNSFGLGVVKTKWPRLLMARGALVDAVFGVEHSPTGCIDGGVTRGDAFHAVGECGPLGFDPAHRHICR